jgi:hypothetical protein
MITFVTCWYELKSKFNKNIYEKWMINLLTNVNNFNLVIYTNKYSCQTINKYIDSNNCKIKVVNIELEDFYNYKYKDLWIRNHEQNISLNKKVNWHVNMLWSEKISFVKHAAENMYFDTEWYGWCDIGYFRGRRNDIPSYLISSWPNHNVIRSLDKTKIHYANVCNNQHYMNNLFRCAINKNDEGLPLNPIPPTQCSIAGGFFLIHKENIEWWHNIYDTQLQLYFKHNYLVKDDQIILVDCVFNNIKHFKLYTEQNRKYDNWFMFQRILL